ncbi:hypothetical protein CEE37_10120 [candidate division LCP-89 bacterium B3_LCP]|uniref:VapC45 PIN like domain-containing protein n=1 Tax=candidate division LCP-89 bacterium B3_LCP TaxID=2012998 RepID=A0A532UYP6_UNCL8|nr:MAG: hypothetical protein CEE37_10120 [candidate division LCP-89 bacterium B3_LCP]
MKYFFDNCFSKKLTKFLAELGIEKNQTIKHLQDMFSQNVQDEEWIRDLSKDGNWVVLTSDLRIAKNRTTKTVLQDSGLTTFFFPKKFSQLDIFEQSWRTIKKWPEIVKYSEKRPKGSWFELNGNFKIIDKN